MSMRTARHLLEAKAPDIFAIGPDDPVLDAVREMADKHIGALLVIDAGTLVGIVSERDYARKVVLQGRSSHDTPVRDIITVRPVDTTEHCMQIMTERRIRHLPVVEDSAVIGVVSIGDLVKAVIEDQQLEL